MKFLRYCFVGCVTNNIEEVLDKFGKGVRYRSRKESSAVGKMQVPVGQVSTCNYIGVAISSTVTQVVVHTNNLQLLCHCNSAYIVDLFNRCFCLPGLEVSILAPHFCGPHFTPRRMVMWLS